jgi:hypothetical protein
MASSIRLWAWQIVHWTGRVIATALALMVVVFLVGEGGPNPFKSTLFENLQHLAFIVLVPLTLIAGWRWPLAAGIVGAGALLTFYIMNFIGSGRWPGGAFPLFFIPPALFVMDWMLRSDRGHDLPSKVQAP